MTYHHHNGTPVWRIRVDGSRAYVVPAWARRDGSVRCEVVENRQLVRISCSGCEYWTGRDETYRRCGVDGTMTRHDDACEAWDART